VVCGDLLVVGSFDGTLRAVRASDGLVQWSTSDLPLEAAPAVVGTRLIAATLDDELIGLSAATGQLSYRQALPGPVHSDVVGAQQQACVATDNGWVVCVDASTGTALWQHRVGERIAASPVLASGLVIALTDAGEATALELGNGKPRWRRAGLGELVAATAAGDRVIVASDRCIHSLALADGASGPIYQGLESTWSTPPVVSATTVLVGEMAGVVHVLDRGNLTPRFVLRGVGQLRAAPGLAPSGEVMLGFEDKVLLGFRGLP
jgi:hypothetical protein